MRLVGGQRQVVNGGHLQLKMINTHDVPFNKVLISGAFHSHQIIICDANFPVFVDQEINHLSIKTFRHMLAIKCRKL